MAHVTAEAPPPVAAIPACGAGSGDTRYGQIEERFLTRRIHGFGMTDIAMADVADSRGFGMTGFRFVTENGGEGDVVDFGVGAPVGAGGNGDLVFAGEIIELGIAAKLR